MAVLTNQSITGKNIKVERIEPAFWWTGMKSKHLQLLIYGKNISETSVSLKSDDAKLMKINQVENPNYLFLDIEIKADARPGKFPIIFKLKSKNIFKYEYELKKRVSKSSERTGFDASDVVYLIMPDRFANGNPKNDNLHGMEGTDRNNPDGRHGGDLEGINQNINYFNELGVTALWLNPFLENNMPATSYHGYAITDFYKTDPRLGTNNEFKKLVNNCHKNNLKVLMDMVFNHCGSEHWFIKDMPTKDWVHEFPEFTRSNYRGITQSDPHKAEFDIHKMEKGWFDVTMPDLNQNNPFVAKYLIQNSIWWIEFSGIDGIRMDTQPYPDKHFMAKWAKQVLTEYPGFNIVGEVWLQEEPLTAYWQKDAKNLDGYNSYLPCVTDFPWRFSVVKALNEPEGWKEGLCRIYYTIAQDFLYPKSENLLIFLDNHDLTRIYTELNHNFNKFEIAMTLLLTMRGIPQLYYGTEILMDGFEHDGHGFIRQDFPGGWENDKENAFTKENLTNEQKQAFKFTQKLLAWRKNNILIHNGELTHFIPEDGIYVYFRHNQHEAVMVIINVYNKRVIDTSRFSEFLDGFSTGYEVINGNIINDLSKIKIEGMSSMIIELRGK